MVFQKWVLPVLASFKEVVLYSIRQLELEHSRQFEFAAYVDKLTVFLHEYIDKVQQWTQMAFFEVYDEKWLLVPDHFRTGDNSDARHGPGYLKGFAETAF